MITIKIINYPEWAENWGPSLWKAPYPEERRNIWNVSVMELTAIFTIDEARAFNPPEGAATLVVDAQAFVAIYRKERKEVDFYLEENTNYIYDYGENTITKVIVAEAKFPWVPVALGVLGFGLLGLLALATMPKALR